MFNHRDYLAEMLEPSIRLRIGAGIDDIFEVSVARLEQNREAVTTLLRSLPGLEDGGTWKLFRPYTDWDGTAAKVLVVLGEHLGLWRAHPPQASPELWLDEVYPIILGGTLTETTTQRNVPKPSAGDLESVEEAAARAATTSCASCGRPMGPWDSLVHVLNAGEPDGDTCIECAAGLR